MLLRELCFVAHFESNVRACDRVLYELSRAARSPEVEQLERLTEAGVAALESDGERALAQAEALPVFEDPKLELLRWAVLIRAGRLTGPERFAEVLDRAAAYVETSGDADALGGLEEGRGLLAYARGDFAAAAEAQGRAAELFRLVASQLSARLNRASALLDDLRPDEAHAAARAALERASEARLTLFEARAAWLVRAAAYRRGDGGPPDLELMDAMRHLGNLDLIALVGLYEGAFAWRAGDSETARELAQRAHRTWRRLGRRWPALLAQTLGLAAGVEASADELEVVAREAGACPLPRLRGQALALMRLAGSAREGEVEAGAALRDGIPLDRLGVRFEVLSPGEIL